MIEQTFSQRRCRDTRKPLESQCPDVVFYRCSKCGALFPVTGETVEQEKKLICCGEKADRLIPVQEQETITRAGISYQITGGYNDNAVRVAWSGEKPKWIYLKTFTGGYLKYVMETKRPPMVFALADTDAFAYCDEDPCLECVFRCKRGYMVYAYLAGIGLVELSLDKMNAQWQSNAKKQG